MYAELLCPAAQLVESIQWWRVDRLLKTRMVRLDTGDIGTAMQILPACCASQGTEDALTP